MCLELRTPFSWTFREIKSRSALFSLNGFFAVPYGFLFDV